MSTLNYQHKVASLRWILISIDPATCNIAPPSHQPLGPSGEHHTKNKGTCHWLFFQRNWNSMQISFCCHLDFHKVIATKFCTWHNSCTILACAKMCFHLMASNRITARWIFHWIRILRKKSLVKRGHWSHHKRKYYASRLDWNEKIAYMILQQYHCFICWINSYLRDRL